MKKIITLSILSVFSIVLLTACGAQPSPESHTGEITMKHLNQHKVQKIIKKAGEDAGWIMTEFKSNAMIAEKIDDGDTESVTVKFGTSSYDISPENSELKSAIDSAFN